MMHAIKHFLGEPVTTTDAIVWLLYWHIVVRWLEPLRRARADMRAQQGRR